MKNTTSQKSVLGALCKAYALERSVQFYLLVVALLLLMVLQKMELGSFAMYALLGWCAYFCEEYFSHVFVFHGFMPKSPALYRLIYRLHLGHHDKPRRIDLLFTPMWYTLPALLLNMAVFALITRDAMTTAALSVGLIAGYLLFEWWHLLIHSPYLPGRILSYVRGQHMGHHHWNEKRWYIISPPAVILDVLFGTSGTVQKSPRSKSPMTAGLDADDVRLLSARAHYRQRSDGSEDESSIWLFQQNHNSY